MNIRRAIILAGIIGAATVAPPIYSADKETETPWETVLVGPGKIAVPKGWRNLDKIKPTMIIFRQGDGIGVPALDETEAPLQILMTVEKFPDTKESVKEIIDGLLEGAKQAPGLTLVGKESVDIIKLSDDTEAMLLTTEFIKHGSRRSLQMKLVAKDADGNAWIVSGGVVGGKDSKWPSAASSHSKWLRAHLTSFCLNKKKFETEKLKAAYDERDKK